MPRKGYKRASGRSVGMPQLMTAQNFNRRISAEEALILATAGDGSITTSLEFVELRLGNVCNVQCRTCNPASSSKWRRDYEEVVEKLEFVNDGYSWLDHKRDFKWPENDSFYEDLYECAPSMRVL